MRHNPNPIRAMRAKPRAGSRVSPGAKRGASRLKSARIAAFAAFICAQVLAASAFYSAPAFAQGCTACTAAADIASAFLEKSKVLETRAAALEGVARIAANPATTTWPGPARRDAVATIWTHGGAQLALARRAGTAALAAQGVAAVAVSAGRAAGQCDAEKFCASARLDAASSPRACAAAQSLSSAQIASVLGGINSTVVALEGDGRSCAALACPDADCAARADLLEAAAFTQGILGAAMGTLPTTGSNDDDAIIPEFVAGIATGALDQILKLAGAVTSSGVDPAKVQKAAVHFAEFETQLAHNADTDDPHPGWRATAARLALAGLRDGLSRLSLSGINTAPAATGVDNMKMVQWLQFAARVEKAVATLVRMDHARRTALVRATASPRAQCNLVDARVSSALARLSRAFNLSAECSVRAECDVRDAIERGTARAATLLASPVLEPQLEVLRALEEEAGISRAVAAKAAVQSSPAPTARFSRHPYQQGEAIVLHIETNKNRCLVEGGLVTLLRDDAGRKPPLLPKSVDDLPKSIGSLPFAAKPPPRLLMNAPSAGNYMLAVYGSASYGGPRLASVPLRVTGGEPLECAGWTGVWQTEFGRMVTIERPDGTVTGSYRQSSGVRPGFIIGRTRNGQLDGEWTSEIGGGGTRLRLLGEGVFRGGWGLSANRVNNGGRWSGICVASPANDASAGATRKNSGH